MCLVEVCVSDEFTHLSKTEQVNPPINCSCQDVTELLHKKNLCYMDRQLGIEHVRPVNIALHSCMCTSMLTVMHGECIQLHGFVRRWTKCRLPEREVPGKIR
eukprot:scpid29785/ scgid11210/ 